ncbi:MAG TPA: HrpB1 family type III secretion system apparatus protein [Paraburkholderia sp.]|nr:HrpB1 family type III secretion system apparatus protein [Paraburkholderia sp.]
MFAKQSLPTSAATQPGADPTNAVQPGAARPDAARPDAARTDFMRCGDATLGALIEVASASLFTHFPQASTDTLDIELVLDALRTLRPQVPEIDTLQGVLHIVHSRWDEAAATLREVIGAAPQFGYALAMYADCLATRGDASWRQQAEQALEADSGPETAALIRALRVRADLDDARANARNGQLTLPDSYREMVAEQDGSAEPAQSTSSGITSFPSHAFLRA